MADSTTTSPLSSIHRRNRDLDFVLLFFFGMFVFLELKRVKKIESHTSQAIRLGNMTFSPSHDAINMDSDDDNTANLDNNDDSRPFIAVNWQHILSHPDCTLRDDVDSPLPLVFMALGRTGSSVTWATVAKILGDEEPEKAIEIVGRVQPEATQFFQDIPEELNSTWPSAYICDLQSNFTQRGLHSKGLVGFQWKPYMVEFDNPKAWSGLRDMAAVALKMGSTTTTLKSLGSQQHPKIRVIYQTRNAIDRRLSNWKHSLSDKSVAPHCPMGDLQCVENHIKNIKMVNFTTGNELLRWLRHDKEQEQKIINRLKEVGVDFIQVTYEKLYDSQVANEWMRIFKFLGRGPRHGLTMDRVQENFSMMKTSSNKTHKDVMANYLEVQKTLQGTEFEYLLN
mmetsp:Transcript_8581/g.16195  ORF Transcript_8581/g.16195 Transcript_8581/m.16195 type:complete len:395 (+) Transcript_8581:110-1294(+)